MGSLYEFHYVHTVPAYALNLKQLFFVNVLSMHHALLSLLLTVRFYAPSTKNTRFTMRHTKNYFDAPQQDRVAQRFCISAPANTRHPFHVVAADTLILSCITSNMRHAPTSRRLSPFAPHQKHVTYPSVQPLSLLHPTRHNTGTPHHSRPTQQIFIQCPTQYASHTLLAATPSLCPIRNYAEVGHAKHKSTVRSMFHP